MKKEKTVTILLPDRKFRFQGPESLPTAAEKGSVAIDSFFSLLQQSSSYSSSSLGLLSKNNWESKAGVGVICSEHISIGVRVFWRILYYIPEMSKTSKITLVHLDLGIGHLYHHERLEYEHFRSN
jgi:hypothetical protein